jgi:alpha-L-fucosidase 2
VEELAVSGRKTAQINYGCRGWTAHYRTDGWRQSATTGGLPQYATWPMGGVWLCQNLYNHYTFNGDVEYLRRVRTSVPVVVTAARKPVKTASPEASVVEFDTRAGGVYELTRKG